MALVIGLFALCLKESAVGSILTAPVAAAAIQVSNVSARRGGYRPGLCLSILQNWSDFVLSLACLALYLVTRFLIVGAPLQYEGSRYTLSIGLNVFRNVAVMMGALLYQGSTLDLFPRLRLPNLMLGSVSSVLFWGILWWLRRRRNNGSLLHLNSLVAAGLMLMVVAGMFPVALLGNVSELYVYTPAAWLALIIAWSAVSLREWRLWSIRLRLMMLGTIWLVLVVQTYGTLQKQAIAISTGELTRSYVKQQVELSRSLPDRASLCWKSPISVDRPYSVWYIDRSDLYVTVVPVAEAISGKHVRLLHRSSQSTSTMTCDFEVRDTAGTLVISSPTNQ